MAASPNLARLRGRERHRFGDHHDKIDFLDGRTGKLLGQDR
jgi:hypothetical protein